MSTIEHLYLHNTTSKRAGLQVSKTVHGIGTKFYKLGQWDVFGGVRGRGSKALVETINSQVSVNVIGDSAIVAAKFIEPSKDGLPADMLDWMESSGEYVVFNVGAQPARNYGCHRPQSLKAFQVNLLQMLLERGHLLRALHFPKIPRLMTSHW